MTETFTVPEHLTSEFVAWLGQHGLSVVEEVGYVPTRFAIRSLGGGDGGGRVARPGDTFVWDKQAGTLFHHRSPDDGE
jgi:hypothetical protein